MKPIELKLNCDGPCKQRKYLNELLLLNLGINTRNRDTNIYICRECLKKARELKLEDIEYY